MISYPILEATNLLIARYGWALRRCRRRFDDGPLRYILLDSTGAVVEGPKLNRQRRLGLDLSEILTLLTLQRNAELASAAAHLLNNLGEVTDGAPQ